MIQIGGSRIPPNKIHESLRSILEDTEVVPIVFFAHLHGKMIVYINGAIKDHEGFSDGLEELIRKYAHIESVENEKEAQNGSSNY